MKRKNLGTQPMICMKKLRFSSQLRAKVWCRRPPGSARAQPCSDTGKEKSRPFLLANPLS